MKIGGLYRPCYILDTNIWLDWLIFADGGLNTLKVAHANTEFHIIYTATMYEELADVIARSQFSLSQSMQLDKLAQMRGLAHEVATLPTPKVSIHCKDKDDQVFIDMALAHRVTWLISKDKHLLQLKKRALKQQLQIGTIDDWNKVRYTR